MAAAVKRRARARERRGEGDAPGSDGAMWVVFFMGFFLLVGKRQNELVEPSTLCFQFLLWLDCWLH